MACSAPTTGGIGLTVEGDTFFAASRAKGAPLWPEAHRYVRPRFGGFRLQREPITMKHLASIFALILVGGYALSQEVTGPASAMLEYAEASKSFDAARIASLMHPEALQRARESFESAFRGENSDRARAHLLPIFSVSTYDEFVGLSDVEAFRRLNESVSRADPELVEIMATAEYEVIGQVQRGDEVFLTYVFTVTLEGRPISQEVVQRLKQHQGEWLLMLPASSEATIAAIEAQY